MDKTLNIKIKNFQILLIIIYFYLNSVIRFKNVSMLEIFYQQKRYNFNKKFD